MSDAIETAIQALIRECGTVTPSGSVNQFLEADSVEDLRDGMIAAIAAYRDSEIEALRAKLADCQAVIRDRGHNADCERNWCRHCDVAMHAHTFPISHPLESRPCSDACGHDRTTGEKA